MGIKDDEGARGMPTEKEIRRACRRIRKTWTEQERRRRAGKIDRKPEPWTPPLVKISSLLPDIAAMIESINKNDEMDGRSDATLRR
jgi:hypothetical protein